MAELLDTARFWLERGVDGFRLDAVDFLMHDPQLRANPPMAPASSVIPAKPFGLQRHIHDMAHAETAGLLARLREVAEEYGGRVLLGELSSQPGAGQRIDRYTRQGGLHSAYTLDLPKQPFGARALFSALMAAGSGATTCWSFSNHDVERAASRWKPAGADPGQFAALLALLFCCLPGTLCLYQGEELGLPQAELGYDDLRDPFGMAFWPEFPGRDGGRTPMPWIGGARHAGFTDAETPWLPVPGYSPGAGGGRAGDGPRLHPQRLAALSGASAPIPRPDARRPRRSGRGRRGAGLLARRPAGRGLQPVERAG